MLISTLYVSRSLIEPARATAAVADLVEASIANNLRRDISGALLFTGDHFAQIMEGPEDNIAALMTSIEHDERHQSVTVIRRTPIRERKFQDWALAYNGPSLFIARHVARVLASPPGVDKQRTARWLTDMMLELMTV
ncbi:BLUF domain-containing protein [Sphingopyxis sp.]|uniref:BLUF domain-containing protein n=1 Tax=Sphingopyxis sp. TaxID=1908224 RepID=UPI001D4D46B6|nr:BLUF domain-containing protein [Sphingopyxis sp.]MBW8297327.1 BLUF domain-containing protein [Sphingopyxis sp.]